MNTIIKRITLIGFTFGLLMMAVSSANAAFTVNTTLDTPDSTPDGICADPFGNCSLRAAITESNDLAGADVITLPAGTYTQMLVAPSENLNVGGDWDITTAITINGAGSGTTILQANALPGVATERVLHCITAATAVVINDVTIQNGNYFTGTFGGGLRLETNSTNVTLNRVIVTNNRTAGSGGGIHFATAGTTLTVNNSTISDNKALGGNGGGINSTVNHTLNINNSVLTGNTSTSTSTLSTTGGAITSGNNAGTSTISITGSTISNNSSTNTATGSGYGGAIFSRDTNLTITGSTLSNNSTNGSGGAITCWLGSTTGRATIITGSTISNNTATPNPAESGSGGITFDNFSVSSIGTLNIVNSTLSGNTAPTTGKGGAIFSWVEPGLAGSNIVNITDSVIRGNSAQTGGGIFNESAGIGAGDISLINSTVRDNTSAEDGGGIHNLCSSTGSANVNLTNSTVSGNTVPTATRDGGGIFNGGFLASTNALNSTISGNSASNGGGIAHESTGSVDLNFVTVAFNNATTNAGGGLLQGLAGAGPINIKNTIVANNTSFGISPDIFGVITSQDYNHIRNATTPPGFTAMTNDVTGTDPMLVGVLALNSLNPSVLTKSHLPMALSPVVNIIPNGINGCGTPSITTSQNGVPRPTALGCEKGAVEIPLAPTAANASIRGRIFTPFGRGLTNATVVLTNSNTGEIRMARSASFGYFNFQDLQTGDFYILNVNSKRYTFNPQSFTLNENIDDLILTPQ